MSAGTSRRSSVLYEPQDVATHTQSRSSSRASAAIGPATSISQPRNDDVNDGPHGIVSSSPVTAVRLKWRSYVAPPLQQAEGAAGAASGPSPALQLFTQSAPSAQSQQEEQHARRSPPLLPCCASPLLSVPWAPGDDRAGWGRPTEDGGTTRHQHHRTRSLGSATTAHTLRSDPLTDAPVGVPSAGLTPIASVRAEYIAVPRAADMPTTHERKYRDLAKKWGRRMLRSSRSLGYATPPPHDTASVSTIRDEEDDFASLFPHSRHLTPHSINYSHNNHNDEDANRFYDNDHDDRDRDSDDADANYYNDESMQEGIIEGDLGCCCGLLDCCFFPIQSDANVYANTSPENSERYDEDVEDYVVGGGGAPDAHNQGPHLPRRGWDSLQRKLLRTYVFFNVFSSKGGRMPFIAKLYCLLNYMAGLLMMTTTIAIAIHEAGITRSAVISDGSVCEGYHFHDRVRPDMSFSLLCFVINCVFTIWFALRGARYEKSGFLLGHGVVVAVQLGRLIYFSNFVVQRYLTEWPYAHVSQWVLVASGVLWVLSVCLAYGVRQHFGWRPFQHGITLDRNLALRRRYMHLQTCLQLDCVVTINSYLAILFLSDTWRQQVVALMMTMAVLVVLYMFIPLLRWNNNNNNNSITDTATSNSSLCRNSYVLLTAMSVVLTVSCVYTMYVIGGNAVLSNPPPHEQPHESTTDTHNNNDEEGRDGHNWCYRGPLQSCLADSDIFIVNSSYSVLLSIPSNGTSTFLPTRSTAGDYFMLYACDYEQCFLKQAQRYVGLITHCCATYGRCRLKDSFRVYDVVLLLFLFAAMLTVRVALVVTAWRRVVEEDDVAIRALVSPRQQRYRDTSRALQYSPPPTSRRGLFLN